MKFGLQRSAYCRSAQCHPTPPALAWELFEKHSAASRVGISRAWGPVGNWPTVSTTRFIHFPPRPPPVSISGLIRVLSWRKTKFGAPVRFIRLALPTSPPILSLI